MAGAIPHGQAHGFLFSDLRDYTRYVETHGDQAAAALLGRYRAVVREAVRQFAGAEIRTEGDSFYVVFDSASAAVRCGITILEGAATTTDSGAVIRVGIGVHAGETVETSEGLVGSAVNIAARVCSQATAGELLVTDTVRSLTRGVVPYRFTPRGARRLKGIDEPIALYRVEPVGGNAVVGTAVGRRPTRVALGWPVSRIWRIVAVVSIALAVVTVALGAAAGIDPFAASRASQSGGSPFASAPLGRSAQAAASGSSTDTPTFPTAAESDLISRLPTTVRGPNDADCKRAAATDVAANALVSIRCTLDPATADAAFVIYDEFTAEETMAKDFNDLEAAYRLVQGECSTHPVAWQSWAEAGFSGKLACYADASGDVWVAWTYDGSFILGRASRPDNQWQKLYGWWVEASAFMVR